MNLPTTESLALLAATLHQPGYREASSVLQALEIWFAADAKIKEQQKAFHDQKANFPEPSYDPRRDPNVQPLRIHIQCPHCDAVMLDLPASTAKHLDAAICPACQKSGLLVLPTSSDTPPAA